MFNLPELKYSYDSLEPFIDAKTMEIHHSKHHQGYVDKLNDTLKDHPDLQNMDIDELLKNIDSVPVDIRQKVINFGGGHANHSFFWRVMGPKDDKSDSSWFEPFKEEFIQKALTLFGSGWVWLVKNNGKLEVLSTLNQNSPLSQNKIPVLCIDLWEHAYYLKYQNKRADYINAWLNIVNWKVAENISTQS